MWVICKVMKIYKLLVLAFVVVGCAQRDLFTSPVLQSKSLNSDSTIPQCNKLPSNNVSIFVVLKLPPFIGIEILVGEDFVHAQPSVSFSTPFLEVGVQDEFPVGKTKSDFLYLVIIDPAQLNGKQRKIYCFDLDGKSVEIIPARQHYMPLRIIVSKKEMKIYQAESEVIQYETLDGRHILTVDDTGNQIDFLEIKPLVSLPERLAKPKAEFKFCNEAFINRKISTVLVCPSDLLEFILGFFPSLIGRFNPTLGWLTLFVGEGGILIFFIKKAIEQPNFIKSVLLFLFITWLLLVVTNFWPYALLYP